MSKRRRHWIVFGLIALVVLAADQATKAVVRSQIAFGDEVPAFGPFSIHHVRNSGIIGGHLQGIALPLGIATTVVIAGIVVYFARLGTMRPAFTLAAGLLLGGSLGNLIDRLRLGYVTDFLDRDGGGAFNLADVSITIGVAAIAVAVLLRTSKASSPQSPGASDSQA